MEHSFKARIYKTGINWCVDVPSKIIKQLAADKGRFHIRGQINGFDFTKTLVPVKGGPYRLFVNQAMMKGGGTAVDKTAEFKIEPNKKRVVKAYRAPKALTEQLKLHKLTKEFKDLTASRRKDILKYLSYIKTDEILLKNVDKVIRQLKNKEKHVRIP